MKVAPRTETRMEPGKEWSSSAKGADSGARRRCASRRRGITTGCRVSAGQQDLSLSGQIRPTYQQGKQLEFRLAQRGDGEACGNDPQRPGRSRVGRGRTAGEQFGLGAGDGVRSVQLCQPQGEDQPAQDVRDELRGPMPDEGVLMGDGSTESQASGRSERTGADQEPWHSRLRQPVYPATPPCRGFRGGRVRLVPGAFLRRHTESARPGCDARDDLPVAY